jgi:hypothetical protein
MKSKIIIPFSLEGHFSKMRKPSKDNNNNNNKFPTWNMYMKLAMSKGNHVKTKKIIHLLKTYCKARKYYIQLSKQYKNVHR